MCEVMERYEKIAVRKANINKIQNMIKKGYSKREILDIGFNEDEFVEAEKQLLQLV